MMLEIDDIHVYYGRVHVIRGVSFKIKEGETVFIIGPNGAGKTTILNTTCGILHPRTGSIKFQGERIDQMSPSTIAKKGIIMVPQGRRLFNDQSVIDNLRLGYYTRLKDKDFDSCAETVLNTFPVLKGRENQLAGTLSGGEQQMLAIGRAMMAKPRLLLCDEMSLGLAPLVVEVVFDSLARLQATGITILIVEQMVWKAFEIASRGYILTLGKISLEGDTKTLVHDARVKEVYLPAAER